MKEKIIKLIEDVLKVPAGTITEDTMIEDVEQGFPGACHDHRTVGGRTWCQHSLRRSH